jgi:hypothetical protein
MFYLWVFVLSCLYVCWVSFLQKIYFNVAKDGLKWKGITFSLTIFHAYLWKRYKSLLHYMYFHQHVFYIVDHLKSEGLYFVHHIYNYLNCFPCLHFFNFL